MTMKFHPVADIFPMLPEQELQNLADDIKANGLKTPIIMYDDMILDGRNRYKACKMARVEPDFKQFKGNDPLAYVISLNLHRRHLNESQRAGVAAKIANMTHGGDRKSKDQAANWRLDISQPKAAEMLNVSERTLQRYKAVEREAPELIKRIDSGEITVHEAKKEIKEKILEAKKDEYKKTVTAEKSTSRRIDIHKTDKKFRIILADPPWSYNDKSDTPNLGGAQKHYRTMATSEISSLPVKDISEKNAVLFLWVTSPLLEECFTVIGSWGFQYKTSFVWDKVKHNMGHYNSVRHEFLLICTKGSCTPDSKILADSVVSIERTDSHSQKPIEFLNIIDSLYTHGERIELFARESRSSLWYVWGDQV